MGGWTDGRMIVTFVTDMKSLTYMCKNRSLVFGLRLIGLDGVRMPMIN